MTAAAIIESYIIGIDIRHTQVAVSVVVAVRFIVLAVSQPPIAAIRRLPRTLLTDPAFHRILRAATAAVGTTSDVHNEVRFPGVILYILSQGVVHKRPVVLVAR